MSFAIDELGKIDAPKRETPRIHSEAFRHSIVESSYQPERSLLTQVDGTPRLTEYYRQFINEGEEPAPFGPNDSPTHQSYTRIKNLVIKQEGTGGFNFENDTGESSRTYNAWIMYDLTPIRGDVMVMDIGDGRAGLFAITEQPEIRNFTANKVYYITFQLLGILTEELFTKLNERVVEDFIYSTDSALHGGKSVITKSEHTIQEELIKWSGTIAGNILNKFYWNPERTIVWKTSDGKTVYDQYLVNFINGVITSDLKQGYPYIKEFSTQYGGREFGMYGNYNIWRVLETGDFNMLSTCQHQAALISASRVNSTRLYGTIRSSKIDLFVATDPEQYKSLIHHYNFDGIPVVNPGNHQSLDYLFSTGFYSGQPEGEFEGLVFDILKNKVIDRTRLLNYIKDYFELSDKEQLYRGAILLMLINLSRKIGATF